MGAGAAIGAIQSYALREYFNYPIPVISDYIGNWGTTATLGNILIGGVAFSIAQFTKIFKGNIKNLIKIYGLVAVAGGIINGALPVTLGAPTRRVSTLSYGRNGYIEPTYYPYYDYVRDIPIKGRFVSRPATRAAGFGSDITRNPMAMIPTTVPYNKIVF